MGKILAKDIPAAKYYVLSNDNFMSGWPGTDTEGKINTCVVPCDTLEWTEAVKAYVESREEQKYIRVVSSRPRAKSHVVYSLAPGWRDRAREYSTLKAEHFDRWVAGG